MMRTISAVTLALFILAAANLSRAGEVTIMPASPFVINCHPFGGALLEQPWTPYMGVHI